MFHELGLQGLISFAGGSIDRLFSRQLQRAILDCDDRPGDKSARTVTVELKIKPVLQQGDGQGGAAIIDVAVEAQVKSKLPNYISKTVECQVKNGGRAVFNDLSPDNANQPSLPLDNDVA